MEKRPEYLEELVVLLPKCQSIIEGSIAAIFSSRPKPVLMYRKRTPLRWMKPDGKGGLRTLMTILACALLAGCATIDYSTPPSADWPKMQTVIVEAHGEELNKLCCGALACARADFKNRICYIVTGNLAQWILDHEDGHCKGYDHPGEHTTVGAWEHYKATGQYRQCKEN